MRFHFRWFSFAFSESLSIDIVNFAFVGWSFDLLFVWETTEINFINLKGRHRLPCVTRQLTVKRKTIKVNRKCEHWNWLSFLVPSKIMHIDWKRVTANDDHKNYYYSLCKRRTQIQFSFSNFSMLTLPPHINYKININ